MYSGLSPFANCNAFRFLYLKPLMSWAMLYFSSNDLWGPFINSLAFWPYFTSWLIKSWRLRHWILWYFGNSICAVGVKMAFGCDHIVLNRVMIFQYLSFISDIILLFGWKQAYDMNNHAHSYISTCLYFIIYLFNDDIVFLYWSWCFHKVTSLSCL